MQALPDDSLWLWFATSDLVCTRGPSEICTIGPPTLDNHEMTGLSKTGKSGSKPDQGRDRATTFR